MEARHFEFLVEEESMMAFLQIVLPDCLLPGNCTFEIYPFRGKQALLRDLPTRLHSYRRWLPNNWRIVVLVDQDVQDCEELKRKLEDIASEAGLRTRSRTQSHDWQLVNRIVVEELEAWYFGDWEAVVCAYPRVPRSIPRKTQYRDPDAIQGGTCEAFERILQKCGYFRSGLGKIQAARAIARHIRPERNRSASFGALREILAEASLLE